MGKATNSFREEGRGKEGGRKQKASIFNNLRFWLVEEDGTEKKKIQ